MKAQKILPAIAGALFCLWLSSCPTPSGPTQPEAKVPVPAWVKANVSGSTQVSVLWENNGSSYKLYRRCGLGAWEQIADGLSSSNFQDSNYASALAITTQTKNLQYSVRAISNGQVSDFSLASNPAYPIVCDTQASLMSTANSISLNWTAHPDAESYNIYRFPNGSGLSTDPVLIANLATSTAPSFSDIPSGNGDPKSGTPYYYKVAWVNNGTEYGKDDAIIAPGAYGSMVDPYEPNQDLTQIPNQSTVFSPSQSPLIYAFSDARGGMVRDVDWYLYKATAGQVFTVQITLPNGSVFKNGDLRFRFYYQGKYYPANGQAINAGQNQFDYTQFAAGSSGLQDVYFVVDTQCSQNLVGSYNVEIIN